MPELLTVHKNVQAVHSGLVTQAGRLDEAFSRADRSDAAVAQLQQEVRDLKRDLAVLKGMALKWQSASTG